MIQALVPLGAEDWRPGKLFDREILQTLDDLSDQELRGLTKVCVYLSRAVGQKRRERLAQKK